VPIYEYACKKCGHQAEIWQKFSDPLISKCELCHGKMKKIISQSTFHLKGSGWYVTDYASKRGGKETKSTKSDKDTGSKETKSAADKSEKKSPSTGDKKGQEKH